MKMRSDEGSATIAAVIAGVVIVSVSGLLIASAEMTLTRHRLAGVADLAALATAQSWDASCDHAARISEVNGAYLLSCRHEPPDVVVEVGMRTPALTARLFTLFGFDERGLTARARAGW